jgi:hypothetical protein
VRLKEQERKKGRSTKLSQETDRQTDRQTDTDIQQQSLSSRDNQVDLRSKYEVRAMRVEFA